MADLRGAREIAQCRIDDAACERCSIAAVIGSDGDAQRRQVAGLRHGARIGEPGGDEMRDLPPVVGRAAGDVEQQVVDARGRSVWHGQALAQSEYAEAARNRGHCGQRPRPAGGRDTMTGNRSGRARPADDVHLQRSDMQPEAARSRADAGIGGRDCGVGGVITGSAAAARRERTMSA